MACRFSSRTRPWPACSDLPDKICIREEEAASGATTGPCPRSPRGSVGPAVILLFIVFAALGLAMVHASGLHLRISGYRKFSTLLDYASENGLKRGLRDLAAWLAEKGPLIPLTEDRLDELRVASGSSFPRLMEEILGAPFPRILSESLDGMSWESRATARLERLTERGDYVRLSAAVRIESAGALSRIAPRRASALEGSLVLLAGRLPLSAIPLLINRDMTEDQKAAFLEDGGIRLLARPGESLPPAFAAVEAGGLPTDPSLLVSKTLEIGMFSPQDLTPERLREALGLAPSAEPVPDGVYLIRGDLGLGGVFVQGDLDEMVLAIEGDAQLICFRGPEAEWLLAFSPTAGWASWRGPDGEQRFDLVPLPIIVVNGRIDSLGGGAIGPDGRVDLSSDSGTPSVLNGVNLTIISSDRVTLASHLILQGVRWQEGVPYVKDTEAQLVVYAAGHDVVSGEARDGGITIGAGAPSDLKLQASLTTVGGFTIEGTGKDIELLGALHAGDFSGDGNTLAIVRDERASVDELPGNSLLTSSMFLAFTSLRVLSWQEY